jgi:hypothetical protein
MKNGSRKAISVEASMANNIKNTTILIQFLRITVTPFAYT